MLMLVLQLNKPLIHAYHCMQAGVVCTDTHVCAHFMND